MDGGARAPSCTPAGCAPGEGNGFQAALPATAVSALLRLDVVSDAICPWCYVAKRRLDGARRILAAEGLDLVVRWRPFQLNPGMPRQGMDRRRYRSLKFGSWERSLLLDAQVAAVGAGEGIAFRHDLIERTPNTAGAHRLAWLAGHEGGPEAQDAAVEALFAAYFVRGLDIGDPAVLAALAAEAGLARTRAAAVLAGDEGTREVAADEAWARRLPVSGVPSFVLNGALLFSGALPAAAIAEALAVGASAVAGATRPGEGAPARAVVR